MEAVAYSTFRNNLRSYLDKTFDDAEPILVTSKNPDTNVVVINAREYDNLMENIRIQSNPYLTDKIEQGLADIASGSFSEHDLMKD